LNSSSNACVSFQFALNVLQPFVSHPLSLNLEWNALGGGGGSGSGGTDDDHGGSTSTGAGSLGGGIDAICDALAAHRYLVHLDLRNNKIPAARAHAIARLIARNSVLTHLGAASGKRAWLTDGENANLCRFHKPAIGITNTPSGMLVLLIASMNSLCLTYCNSKRTRPQLSITHPSPVSLPFSLSPATFYSSHRRPALEPAVCGRRSHPAGRDAHQSHVD
jgi:hypothetical protein